MVSPVPIPPWLLAAIKAEGHPEARPIVVSAPDGDLTSDQIRSVEAIVARDGWTVASVLDPGDVELLTSGAVLMLHLWTERLPVFSLDIVKENRIIDPRDPAP